MRITFTAADGSKLKSVEISGMMLRAFAHSMEHESHSGAEWEGLEDDESGRLIELFEGLGGLAERQADQEGVPAYPAPSW